MPSLLIFRLSLRQSTLRETVLRARLCNYIVGKGKDRDFTIICVFIYTYIFIIYIYMYTNYEYIDIQ